MSRRIHLVASLAALTFASIVPAATAGRSAHAAGGCSVGDGRGYGYSYLDSLSVSGTSCATGRKVAKRHGKGWSCSKKILAESSVQYDARVSCSSGGRHVKWVYTQNK